MANDVFALSPISAPATQATEADYQAIREAFMETARGRWFLGEYAKRNRNADTRLVLDQVARIERMIEALPPATPDTRPAEILAALRSVVDQATDMAASAVDGLAIDDRLAPIRKGARILKEIAWRWREIGAEPRICDSIDAEVDAIQESCRQLARVDTRAALTAAFELMRSRIEALAGAPGPADPPAACPAAKSGSSLAVQVVREDETCSGLATLAGAMMPAACAPVSIRDSAVADERAETDDLLRNAEEALFGPPTNSDPATAIRRMSLIDKFAFFE